MKRVNYKSDFDFILTLTDCNGVDIGWPEFDWEARLYTNSKVNCFIASRYGDVLHGCFNDNGRIHIVANEHGLSRGRLQVEFTAQLPDNIYPDDYRKIVTPSPLDIELTQERGDCPFEAIDTQLGMPLLLQTTPAVSNSSMPQFLNPHVKRHTIPLHAQPGQVYRNNGYISLGAIKADQERWVSFSLSNYYIGKSTYQRKLIERIKGVLWGNQNELTYKIEGDNLLVHITDVSDVILPIRIFFYKTEGCTHITAQKEKDNSTIFTEICYSEAEWTLRPPTEKEVLSRLQGTQLVKSPSLRTQIWRRNRTRWKWRNHQQVKELGKKKSFYIRAKRRNHNGDESAWVYFKAIKTPYDAWSLKGVSH